MPRQSKHVLAAQGIISKMSKHSKNILAVQCLISKMPRQSKHVWQLKVLLSKCPGKLKHFWQLKVVFPTCLAVQAISSRMSRQSESFLGLAHIMPNQIGATEMSFVALVPIAFNQT